MLASARVLQAAVAPPSPGAPPPLQRGPLSAALSTVLAAVSAAEEGEVDAAALLPHMAAAADAWDPASDGGRSPGQRRHSPERRVRESASTGSHAALLGLLGALESEASGAACGACCLSVR